MEAKCCRRLVMEASDALGFPTSIPEICKTVKDLRTCREFHSILVQVNLELAGFWIDHLIRCYALCGNLIDSVNTFKRVAQPTVYTWNSIISAHVNHGESRFASKLYQKMLQQESCKPDKFTYLLVLKTVYSLGTLMLIHDHVIRLGLHSDIAVCNSLLHSYWYVLHGYGLSALEMYGDMKGQGNKPNRATFLSVLKACGSLECAGEGRLIHDEIVRCGLDLDITVGNTLVDMFAKCNILEEAHSIFARIEDETAVSWGVMISGYSMNGQGFQALQLFETMQTKKTKPTRNTLSCIYKACLKACSLEVSFGQGRLIYDLLVKANLDSDIDVGSAVIDMYWKCGSLCEACIVFNKLPSQDVVSMGAMIAGYAEHGEGLLALNLYERMLLNDMKPNIIIYSSILKACGSSALVLQGRYFHDEIIKQKLEMNVIIGNTIIDMYVKFGIMDEAQNVFEQLQIKDDVSWGTIILGCAEHEMNDLVLKLLQRLWKHDLILGKATVLSVIKACSITRSTKYGRWIHNEVIVNGMGKDTIIINSLVDMYIKCGSLDEANNIFQELSNPNLLLWGSMIAGYAIDGNWQLARHYFEGMQHQGLIPDDIIFTCILAACSHSGLLGEGHCREKQGL